MEILKRQNGGTQKYEGRQIRNLKEKHCKRKITF